MIFLDNNSTTPLDKKVIESMMPYINETYGNPHSIHHTVGHDARDALENSRNIISDIVNIDPSRIIFTSGATESNNLFIKGAALRDVKNGKKKKKIFCSSIEHKCVLDACKSCEGLGYESHLIPVNSDGKIDLRWLENRIDNETLLVSVMTVNNETGLRSNVEDINQLCKSNNVLFHSDIAQALIGENLNLGDLNFDGASVSGHKIHGPKGVGLLICNSDPDILLEPILHGGLQEQNVRSGTTPVFLAVGIANALRILYEDHTKNKNYILSLKEEFVGEIQKNKNLKINFHSDNSHPGLLNISLEGDIDSNLFCTRIGDRIAISTAAACSGINFEYSHVLKNMGFNEKIIRSSIRLCFGRQNTIKEARLAARLISEEISRINSIL